MDQSNEREAPAPNMPTLRSQGEFFMTGIVPTSAQPEGSVCSICTEHLAEDVAQIIGACGHMFHAVCLLTWLSGTGRQNRTCPNCRCELYAASVNRSLSGDIHAVRSPEGIMARRTARMTHAQAVQDLERTVRDLEDMATQTRAAEANRASDEDMEMNIFRMEAGMYMESAREEANTSDRARPAIPQRSPLALTPAARDARARSDWNSAFNDDLHSLQRNRLDIQPAATRMQERLGSARPSTDTARMAAAFRQLHEGLDDFDGRRTIIDNDRTRAYLSNAIHRYRDMADSDSDDDMIETLRRNERMAEDAEMRPAEMYRAAANRQADVRELRRRRWAEYQADASEGLSRFASQPFQTRAATASEALPEASTPPPSHD
jgi:hypothetical protein